MPAWIQVGKRPPCPQSPRSPESPSPESECSKQFVVKISQCLINARSWRSVKSRVKLQRIKVLLFGDQQGNYQTCRIDIEKTTKRELNQSETNFAHSHLHVRSILCTQRQHELFEEEVDWKTTVCLGKDVFCRLCSKSC
ncbi:hypothetical protein EIN_357210 [Entamoeba invadens IP1]|uniref:Uncharacterized protein n=1 Tax=Entamoeba invadens IP1 TaxID=370355 RepID=L7FNU3_ENTIV|nr:hypothetical protein EIN_357210 [Entamoeba invadens IP1]ELP88918.1 hypothetical protein EIN_357210 [Entamoeba invadens IP1]|eukprot:XP_004255689.1 hypothetical protein EIN_357210 [Entamoeba invadens IP1]